jgi:hypothetical protein
MGARVWLARFLAAYIGLGVLIQRALTPAPERFPEASNAFFYSTFHGSEIAVACAVIGASGGMALWMLHRGLAKLTSSARAGRPRGLARLFFVIGWIGAIAAVPLIPLETGSYLALTDDGSVSRDYWGAVQRDQWSSLHHVELECGSPTIRNRRNVRPTASLRFDGQRSIGGILRMEPYRGSAREAFGRLEDVRVHEDAPLIWRTPQQGEAFQRQEADVVECVDSFLQHFPPEKRQQMRTELGSNARRAETLASYR